MVLVLPASASAQTITRTQKVVLNAVVLPAQYIIINDQGQITEVDSNSSIQALPQVYLGSIKPANARPLTPQLYLAYQNLVPKTSLAAGILYKFGVTPAHGLDIIALDLQRI